MLPSQNRMRSRLDFAETVRSGSRAGRRDMVVYLLRTDQELAVGSTRFARRSFAVPCSPSAGLIVGKQVGGAVVRKRVSRRLREALRAVVQDFPPGSRLVVRALPSAAGSAVVDFEGQLRSALRKLLPVVPEEPEKLVSPEKRGQL